MIDTILDNLTIYTDGWCRPNPWWDWWYARYIVELDIYWWWKLENSTNNIAELTALSSALEYLLDNMLYAKDIEFVMDSNYAMYTSNGKRKANKNTSLVMWNRFYIKLLAAQSNITWTWVKWHNGNEYNELVDKLCIKYKEWLI